MIFLGLAIGLSPSLRAQNGINFKAGAVLAGDVKLNSFADTAVHRKGFHAGIDVRIGPYGFYLSPGLHYYMIDIQPNTGFNFIANNPKYHIIKGPINLAYKMFITRKFKFRLKGGLDINYVLSIDENPYGVEFDKINDAYFGINIGAGFDISKFTIDFIYESGLTNSIKDNDNSKMNYLSVALGYFL